MRQISLTQGQFTTVDDADFETLSKFKWYYHQGRAVRKPRAIERRRIGFVWMHREIVKPTKNKVVDHINGNTLDNRRENLRECTRSQNQWNKRLRIKSTTGMKNIYWNSKKKRYIVSFQKYGKKHQYGQFSELDKAIKSRNEAALVIHEGFNQVLEVSTSEKSSPFTHL